MSEQLHNRHAYGPLPVLCNVVTLDYDDVHIHQLKINVKNACPVTRNARMIIDNLFLIVQVKQGHNIIVEDYSYNGWSLSNIFQPVAMWLLRYTCDTVPPCR